MSFVFDFVVKHKICGGDDKEEEAFTYETFKQEAKLSQHHDGLL
jgi:hypothetical protein